MAGKHLLFITRPTGYQLTEREGELPRLLGLWWLTLPLLALAIWTYLRDGRLARPRRAAA